MKDWKAECDALRGELREVRAQLAYERSWREARQAADAEIRDKMQRMILDLLAR